ncbi:phosphatidylethanolamine-binding protein [Lineolata rhizophorae]|uniref:Phosphatidylethanolamine-binding protein n=1 Tax=Lineolata rhizophorae TaxID=578093 RepID=A0A6A6NM01_9PEZI|nr:phosphatidylethanolamine-binding protein [Lineolata rhizophorae]
MPALDYVERALSWAFANAKARDAKLFTKGPAFADHPKPTIHITSPECGDSPAELSAKHSAVGDGLFPDLRWTHPDGPLAEYLLICEDADVPLPAPVNHGAFIGIAPSTTSVSSADVEPLNDPQKPFALRGGFWYGKTLRSVPYVPPRPLLGHGPHRYFYELIALSEPLGLRPDPNNPVTRDMLAEAIKGKVSAWGEWIGSYERK